MNNANFFHRIFAGIGIVASLLVLGACQRPRNQMITQFQNISNQKLAKMVSTVRGAKQYRLRGTSSTRGVTEAETISAIQVLPQGYTPYVGNDAAACVQRVQVIPREYKYYWLMVANLIQCLKRLTVNDAYPLYGSAFPYMGDSGQAYMRYLVDPRNAVGNFNMLPYGYGYQWGHQGVAIGSSQNDPLRMWQVLGGTGNGFYAGSF